MSLTNRVAYTFLIAFFAVRFCGSAFGAEVDDAASAGPAAFGGEIDLAVMPARNVAEAPLFPEHQSALARGAGEPETASGQILYMEKRDSILRRMNGHVTSSGEYQALRAKLRDLDDEYTRTQSWRHWRVDTAGAGLSQ